MVKGIARSKNIRDILLIILALNWLVAIAKTIYGTITKSASITADGLHSFADGASNIIGLVGIWAASQPVDKEHPYGHRRYETLAALGITVLLFAVSFDIVKDAIGRLYNPVIPDVTHISFIIMAVTLVINIWVMRYEFRIGKELNSEILVSDSMHTRSDIFVSSSVIVTLVAVKLGMPLLDVIGAFAIAIFIGYAAYRIFRENSEVLCDRCSQYPPEKIKEIVMKVDGVKECHNIRTRGSLDSIYLDLHVLVDSSMHVKKAHDLSHIIIKRIKDEMRGISDVVVHIEPEEDKFQHKEIT